MAQIIAASPLLALASVGAGNASDVIVKASRGALFSVSVSAAANGYLMIFDSATVPASGAVAYPVLRYSAPVTSGSPYSFNWANNPDIYQNGVVVAFSSTAPGTFTPATAIWLGAQVQ